MLDKNTKNGIIMIVDSQKRTKQVVKKFNVNLDLEDEVGPGTAKFVAKGASVSSRGSMNQKGKIPESLYLAQTPSTKMTSISKSTA